MIENCKNQPSSPQREQHVMVFLYRYMRPVRRRRRGNLVTDEPTINRVATGLSGNGGFTGTKILLIRTTNVIFKLKNESILRYRFEGLTIGKRHHFDKFTFIFPPNSNNVSIKAFVGYFGGIQ